MDISEWEQSNYPRGMLEFVQSKTNDRKMRLFACACCRRFWDVLPDDRCRRFIETVEKYADGLVSDADLDRAYFAAEDAAKETGNVHADNLIGLYGACATYEYQDSMRGVIAERAAKLMASDSPYGITAEQAAQSTILRDIIGPAPFENCTFEPAYRVAEAIAIAREMYEACVFLNLQRLSEVLQHCGCANSTLLSHCQQVSPHVKGCWVVDLVLGLQ